MDHTLVVLLIVLGLCILWRIAQERKRERRMRAIRLADIDGMPGLQFEHYVARLFQHRGYNTRVTKGSGDLGVDVIATKRGERLAVQVKRSSQTVSRRAVSDAVAAMKHYGCNGAMVVTNGQFGRGAIQLARSTHCQLVSRDILSDWILAFQGGQSARRKTRQDDWTFPALNDPAPTLDENGQEFRDWLEQDRE